MRAALAYPFSCGHGAGMKALLCVLLFLLGTICSSQADVVIYRGIYKSQRSGNGISNPVPPRANVYFICEFATKKSVTLVFFGTGDKKRYVTDTPATTQVNTAPILGGKSARVLSANFAVYSDENNYSRIVKYFRGVNGTVTSRTEPNKAQVTLPRSFKGYVLFSSADGGVANFLEGVYSLPLDAKETIAANNAGRSIQAAYDALLQRLIKAGYKSNN